MQEPFGDGLGAPRHPHDAGPLIEMVPGPEGVRVPRRHRPPRFALAAALFVATFLSATTLGAYWALPGDAAAAEELAPWGVPLLSPSTVTRVWGDPRLLLRGLMFSVPALFILLCHELGHYAACRRYGLAATLPYFLPFPAAFGTLGAFIRIRSPIRNKRELFDVGVAGPLAGFVALLPFLLYGVAHSTPLPMPEIADPSSADDWVLVLGSNYAFSLAGELFHGGLPPGYGLDLHPFAMAAWFGLLATALNLLPLGQLDGGHILYAVLGRLQRRAALPLWAAVGLLAVLWPGWLVWCLILLLMGLRHPPVRDEGERLDRVRLALAAAALVILVLSFMPAPVAEVPVRLEPPPHRTVAGTQKAPAVRPGPSQVRFGGVGDPRSSGAPRLEAPLRGRHLHRAAFI